MSKQRAYPRRSPWWQVRCNLCAWSSTSDYLYRWEAEEKAKEHNRSEIHKQRQALDSSDD